MINVLCAWSDQASASPFGFTICSMDWIACRHAARMRLKTSSPLYIHVTWIRLLSAPFSENECLHYTILKSSDRASSFKLPTGVSPSCDKDLPLKWYRFMLPAGTKIASTCIPSQRCNTVVTGWMKTPHPKSTDGIDSGEICFRWQSNCCNWSQNIYVRNCGRFYVYKLPHTIGCPMRYCAQPWSKW